MSVVHLVLQSRVPLGISRRAVIAQEQYNVLKGKSDENQRRTDELVLDNRRRIPR